MTPTETAAQLRLAADWIEKNIAEQTKPFILPTPPPGMRWHREDGWTAEMLPPGTRPLCKGEQVQQEDEVWVGSEWCIDTDVGFKMSERDLPTRTTRPLLFTHEGYEWTWHRAGDPCPCDADSAIDVLFADMQVYRNRRDKRDGFHWLDETGPGVIIGWCYADAEKPDPYAELKKAHADGKVIQSFNHERNIWQDCPSPAFEGGTEYRIKPDEIPWIEWHGGPCPLKDEEVEEWEFKRRDGDVVANDEIDPPSTRTWSHNEKLARDLEIIAYRVLKWRDKKLKVKLGPEDVTPFTRLRVKIKSPDFRFTSWIVPLSVNQDGIVVAGRTNVQEISWEAIKSDYERNNSLQTGKWDPDAWENCEK